MSGIDWLPPSHSHIQRRKSPTSQKALDVFLNLLSTCVGPAGKIHMIRNCCGGHVTYTSDCARLLSILSISHPELKLIVTSVEAHLKQHGDCGLFMGCCCIRLIKSSIDTGISVHVQSSLFDLFVKMIQNYLNESDCPICVTADMTNLQVLLAFVGSILRSKCLLNLADSDCEKLTELVVRTFVKSIPTQQPTRYICHSDRVFVIGLGNQSITNSELEHGLLLEYCEMSILGGEIQLDMKRVFKTPGTEGEGDRDSWVNVALFTCSMSGDAEEAIDTTFEVTHDQSVEAEEVVINKMLALGEDLEFLQVGLVLCQKVLHPKVKAQLKAKGIFFIDRLGSQTIPYIQDLTGSQRITSILRRDELQLMIGQVDNVQHVIKGRKSFLHLSTSRSSIVTLILYAQWEERLTEFKACIRAAFQGLHSLVNEPRLLAGGGCWQTHISFTLQQLVQKRLSTIIEEVGCTNVQVLSSLSTFRSSLHYWVRSLADSSSDIVVDPSSFHCWSVPKGNSHPPVLIVDSAILCHCGLKSVPRVHLEDFHSLMSSETLVMTQQQPKYMGQAYVIDVPVHPATVLDSFMAATQALYRGIFTTNLVLSLGQVITDRN